MQAFVLGRGGQPLMPCHPARARALLKDGRATVHRRCPFVIRLKDRCGGDVQPLRVKLDPGSRVTGIAMVREAPGDRVVVLALIELRHRGQAIRDALTARRGFRRRRRGVNLRHRAARFDNRTRPQGWLAPSLQHRVDTVLSWVVRLRRWAPVAAIAQELVRFDPQALERPEICGVEYQQGTLFGYELREYLLEKWQRRCAYCDVEGVPLQIEHIVSRARGGSNRVSNLTLACAGCNSAKGAQDVRAFLAHEPLRLQRLLAQAKAQLKDAAAVNSTRWALWQRLKATGLQVEAASGGRTKFNRARLGIPKTHALDAACVGAVGSIRNWRQPTLAIKATGRGSYQRTRLTKHGFPRGYLTRRKQHFGFQTGDLVRAVVPAGKHAGVHTGRIAVRASGSFNLQTADGAKQGISHRHCTRLQRNDGYGYTVAPFNLG